MTALQWLPVTAVVALVSALGWTQAEIGKALGVLEVAQQTVADDLPKIAELLESVKSSLASGHTPETVSERVALADALLPLEQADAAKRKAAGRKRGTEPPRGAKLTPRGGKKVGQHEGGAKFAPPREKGMATVKAAAVAGMSRPTYEKAAAVVAECLRDGLATQNTPPSGVESWYRRG